MREDRDAERVLDALEAYLATVDPTRAVRKAFLAGVRVGRQVTLSTGSTGAERGALGFVSPPPCTDPPSTTTPLQIYSPDPDPDPKSMARANLRARDTLELFPGGVPRVRLRKRRCAVPDDLALTPPMRAFAEAGGLDAAHELAAMKDHYRGTGEARADWPATYREWCRHSLEFRSRGRGR